MRAHEIGGGVTYASTVVQMGQEGMKLVGTKHKALVSEAFGIWLQYPVY
jgi:hypothetical protein